MTYPKIFVTGATGKTGGQVTAQLLAAGHAVRAFVRREDGRSARLKAAGAEIAVGDLFDPQHLADAMQGVQRAYFLPPFDPYMIQAATAFGVAARGSKLESIVALSQWLANPAHPALATRQHWLADGLFAALPGIAVTIVRPGFFADLPYMSLIRYAAQLGVFPVPARGSSRDAPPSVDDIARVVVAALLDPTRHGGRRYRPTGPDMLSLRDMARIMGGVLGHTVRHINMPLWMFQKAARMDGFDRFLLSQMGHFLHDLDHGAFEMGGPTDDVSEATGRPPESFAVSVRRAAARPEARRSVANFVRAFAGFMSVPLRPGINPADFTRDLCMPAHAAPVLSADSPFWQRERGVAPPGVEAATRSDASTPLPDRHVLQRA